MQITYLGHSGFLVVSGTCALLFDYYTGTLPELPPDTDFYVFVSHRHYDHYSYKIFDLYKIYKNVSYIISDDLRGKIHRQYLQKRAGADGKIMEQITFIKPDEMKSYPQLSLRTTDSTDLGVAFLVTLNTGQTIFHAGDLNWWTWPGEETEAEYQDMTRRFQHEAAKLKDISIDLAFLPLDPRQQDRFYWGFDYYMKHADIKTAVPMHFWKDYTIIDKLLSHEASAGYRDKVIRLHQEGETFTTSICQERKHIMKFTFAHNNFNVLDLEKSLQFYADALDLKEIRREEAEDQSFTLVYLGDGTSRHELELTWLRDRDGTYNLGENEFHLALSVNDFDAAHKKHQEMGCICFENPEMGIYFINDPDGYWIEIIPEEK